MLMYLLLLLLLSHCLVPSDPVMYSRRRTHTPYDVQKTEIRRTLAPWKPRPTDHTSTPSINLLSNIHNGADGIHCRLPHGHRGKNQNRVSNGKSSDEVTSVQPIYLPELLLVRLLLLLGIEEILGYLFFSSFRRSIRWCGQRKWDVVTMPMLWCPPWLTLSLLEASPHTWTTLTSFWVVDFHEDKESNIGKREDGEWRLEW